MKSFIPERTVPIASAVIKKRMIYYGERNSKNKRIDIIPKIQPPASIKMTCISFRGCSIKTAGIGATKKPKVLQPHLGYK